VFASLGVCVARSFGVLCDLSGFLYSSSIVSLWCLRVIETTEKPEKTGEKPERNHRETQKNPEKPKRRETGASPLHMHMCTRFYSKLWALCPMGLY
jgi:hypothetical protein